MTPLQLTLAAQLWNNGKDTLDIAGVVYGSSEARTMECVVFRHLASIRFEARAMKSVRQHNGL